MTTTPDASPRAPLERPALVMVDGAPFYVTSIVDTFERGEPVPVARGLLLGADGVSRQHRAPVAALTPATASALLGAFTARVFGGQAAIPLAPEPAPEVVTGCAEHAEPEPMVPVGAEDPPTEVVAPAPAAE